MITYHLETISASALTREFSQTLWEKKTVENPCLQAILDSQKTVNISKFETVTPN
jgi:hypothetical protein